jgi:protein required for attachment to host cells
MAGQAVTAMPPHTDPKQVEADDFAAALAKGLRHAHDRGEFELLALVAAPRFLGLLRGDLDEQTRRCVVACEHKDLTLVHTHDLPAHLSDVLDAATRAELAAEYRSPGRSP